MARHGGPNGGIPEKSKDFKGSMLKIFNNLESFKKLLILGLVLAFLSALFSIISPNILSDLTDEITAGLQIDEKRIEEVTTKITTNLKESEISNKTKNILMDTSYSYKDTKSLQEYLTCLNNIENEYEGMACYFKLNKKVSNVLFESIIIDDTKITGSEQIEYLKVVSTINKNMTKNEMMKSFEKLPKSIIEVINPKINLNKVKKISITLIIMYLTSSLFGYIQGFSMATVSNNFAKKLRTSISDKINKLPLKYFDNHETGDILSRVTNDVDAIGMNLNQSLSTLVSSSTLFFGSIIMMFYTEWRMALTAILSSIIGFVFMGIILRSSQKYFTKRQEELGNLNGFIEEMYSGHNVVKAYNGEKKAIKEFNELNNKLFIYNRKSQFLSGIMQPLMGFIGNLSYVCVCVVGAILVTKGYITFGVIVAFMIYVRLFTNPLSQIAQSMTSLQSTAAAAERVYEFLEETEMSDESKLIKEVEQKKVKGNIEFKNVKFGYDDSKIIIKDFSLKAKSGEKIAIVGPTGAGKTTLVNLLMKFYEINDGNIIIDGKSIHELSRETIHNLFVMVLQDTWLFDGTVRDNIKFNKKDVSDEEIWNALKVVGVSHFIKTLPGGLDANINDTDSISQGQKQLLTIARGMIENGPFLILDEATSNVDTRTEELVQKAMDKLMIGRTSFIIAHRLSTIKNADKILVLNDGDIVEVGTHEQLMKKKGFYADLYDSQFKNN